MQAGNDFTSRLSDNIGGPTLLRFKTDRRNFHAFLSSTGWFFEGPTEMVGTSEIGLALLLVLLSDGEVLLLGESRVYYC